MIYGELDNKFIKINGGFATVQEAKTASYTVVDADSKIWADSTSSAVTITLPTAVGREGREYYIKNIENTNGVTVNTTLSQTIDFATSRIVARLETVKVCSDGSNWYEV